jgi:hypothetical protein
MPTPPQALTLWCAAVLLGSAPACTPSRSRAPAPSVPPRDTVVRTVTARDPELEARVARVELRLLEKEAELEQLQARLDEARREVVRAMAKLQTLASRAEAASAMAEADLAIQSLRNAAAQAPELVQGGRLLQESSGEFSRDNFGGALYLATQAKSVVAGGQARLASGAERGSPRAGEVLFALPLRLRTQGRANVREGPGTGFRVAFTLEPGVLLTAHAYAEQWVRVSDDEGRAGWVFYNLVGKGAAAP